MAGDDGPAAGFIYSHSHPKAYLSKPARKRQQTSVLLVTCHRLYTAPVCLFCGFFFELPRDFRPDVWFLCSRQELLGQKQAPVSRRTFVSHHPLRVCSRTGHSPESIKVWLPNPVRVWLELIPQAQNVLVVELSMRRDVREYIAGTHSPTSEALFRTIASHILSLLNGARIRDVEV